MEKSSQHLTGKICLITGATSGIGEVTARVLAQLGARVVIVGRSAARSQATLQRIQSAIPGAEVDCLLADLSSQAEIRQLAQQFKLRYPRLDVLINNAGALFMRRRQTVDGIELTFALNHLNYFLLTNLLIERLTASAPARIVNVSSSGHWRASRMDFENLQQPGRWFDGWLAYGQSKLANIMFTYELARRLEGTGVTANVVHPGLVATRFGHNNGLLGSVVMSLVHTVALTPEQGAETLIYLAASPEVEGITGKYFEAKRVLRSSGASYDQAAAKRLWEVSEAMTGLEGKR